MRPIPLSLLLLLATPSRVLASHPLVTDDAGTVARGALEVEIGIEAARPVEADSEARIASGLILHVGLLDRLDVGAGVAYEASLQGRGWAREMADPTLDAKLRLFDGDGAAAPALAVRLDYRAPSNPTGTHHTGHDVGGLLIASWQAGDTALDVDLGAYGVGLGTGEDALLVTASTAVLFQVAPPLRVGLEGVVESHLTAWPEAASALTALQWEQGPTMLSFGLGPTWASGERVGWLATVGVTSTFGDG